MYVCIHAEMFLGQKTGCRVATDIRLRRWVVLHGTVVDKLFKKIHCNDFYTFLAFI